MDKKKRIAAVSAVAAYIKSQEEAAMAAAGAGLDQGPVEEASCAAAPGPRAWSAWGASGRQAQMDGRFLMQMRAFR